MMMEFDVIKMLKNTKLRAGMTVRARVQKLCKTLHEKVSCKSETVVSEPPRLVSPGENPEPGQERGSFRGKAIVD
jgi:hypothetical protein